MEGNTRYSPEQILRGLRQFFQEEIGARDFTDDESLDRYFGQEWLDEIDLQDILNELEAFFGFHCDEKEWDRILLLEIEDAKEWKVIVSPLLTFRVLAAFIAERMEAASFGPVVILGRKCTTAGIFRGIETVAKQIDPKVRQFGPSTRIRDRLRGNALYRFYQRLRWSTEVTLPTPRTIGLGDNANRFSKLTMILGGSILACVLGVQAFVSLSLTKIVLAVLLWIGIDLVNRHLMNPLPKGIETFADLARLLAAKA